MGLRWRAQERLHHFLKVRSFVGSLVMKKPLKTAIDPLQIFLHGEAFTKPFRCFHPKRFLRVTLPSWHQLHPP